MKTDKPNLLVVLGHTMVEGGETNLYIGKDSALARVEVSAAELRAADSPPPLVLLIACATAALGDPFGTLPGTFTAKGAGAVVGTLSKIIGPQAPRPPRTCCTSFHDLAGQRERASATRWLRHDGRSSRRNDRSDSSSSPTARSTRRWWRDVRGRDAPGGHGDALVVEYGTKTDPHQLLIDAGTFHSWDAVRKELLRRRKDRYEVFVVTHVDEDHIGGAISLLDDPNLKQRVDHVWFNGYVHCESGGNVLGPVNGEQLTTRIVEGGFRWNDGFTPKASNDVGGPVVVPTAGDLPRIDLPGGARVVLLSPSGPKLKTMAKKWKERCRERRPRSRRRRLRPHDEPEHRDGSRPTRFPILSTSDAIATLAARTPPTARRRTVRASPSSSSTTTSGCCSAPTLTPRC